MKYLNLLVFVAICFSNYAFSEILTYDSGTNYLDGEGYYYDAIDVTNDAVLYVDGGSYDYISLYDSGIAHLHNITRTDRVTLNGTSSVFLYGSDFMINFSPVELGTYYNESETYMQLSVICTMEDGDSYITTVYLRDDSTLTLVPEPASLVLLSLGGLFFMRNSKGQGVV